MDGRPSLQNRISSFPFYFAFLLSSSTLIHLKYNQCYFNHICTLLILNNTIWNSYIKFVQQTSRLDHQTSSCSTSNYGLQDNRKLLFKLFEFVKSFQADGPRKYFFMNVIIIVNYTLIKTIWIYCKRFIAGINQA
jgi:hypothetical protein